MSSGFFRGPEILNGPVGQSWQDGHIHIFQDGELVQEIGGWWTKQRW